MYISDILRSATAETFFEGRVPAVVLDLTKDIRKLSEQSNGGKLTNDSIRSKVDAYFDRLLWSREKDEWINEMSESQRNHFIECFRSRLVESYTEPVPKRVKEFKVKNVIECDLGGEQVWVSYNACRRDKVNINQFNTISEDNWLDMSEVIDSTGINILDSLSEGERRELVDQCWDDAEELIDFEVARSHN
jgi:hypothetical protein